MDKNISKFDLGSISVTFRQYGYYAIRCVHNLKSKEIHNIMHIF